MCRGEHTTNFVRISTSNHRLKCAWRYASWEWVKGNKFQRFIYQTWMTWDQHCSIIVNSTIQRKSSDGARCILPNRWLPLCFISNFHRSVLELVTDRRQSETTSISFSKGCRRKLSHFDGIFWWLWYRYFIPTSPIVHCSLFILPYSLMLLLISFNSLIPTSFLSSDSKGVLIAVWCEDVKYEGLGSIVWDVGGSIIVGWL